MNFIPVQNVWSPKRLRAPVTERRSCAPARTFREAPMNIILVQNVWSPKRLRASVTERRSCALSGGAYGDHSDPKLLV